MFSFFFVLFAFKLLEIRSNMIKVLDNSLGTTDDDEKDL